MDRVISINVIFSETKSLYLPVYTLCEVEEAPLNIAGVSCQYRKDRTVDTPGVLDTLGALEILNEVNVESLTNSSTDGIGASLLWIWVSLLTFAFLSSSTEEEFRWVLLFIESLIP